MRQCTPQSDTGALFSSFSNPDLVEPQNMPTDQTDTIQTVQNQSPELHAKQLRYV